MSHFSTAVYRMSDCNCIDVMHKAKATLVAVQSTTSSVPLPGEEKIRVLTLNLRNRMIFKADDEAAGEATDFLGQRKLRKTTYGYSGGMLTRSYTEVEEHKIKPYQLRHLKKHQCVGALRKRF